MNIVFVSTYMPSSYVGGAEILTELVACELARRGHNVTIYTGGTRPTTEIKNVHTQQLPLLQPKPLRTLLSPVRSKALRVLLQHDRYFNNADIIHTVDADTLSLLSSWDEIQHKLVVTIQDYGMVCPAGELLYGQRQCPNFCHAKQGFLCLDKRGISPSEKIRLIGIYHIRKFVRDKALARLRYVVCVSHFVNNELLRVAPHVTTRVIGNCVSEDWFTQYTKKKDIDILYVGRLVWYKGVDVLLHAIRELTKKEKISVYIIGQGDNERYAQMLERFELKRRVTLLGAVPHNRILRYYRRAKIVVAPSIWPEPCGRTIIEGMATGCAVVATHTGGTPESLHDGVTGALVPPANHLLLAKTIQGLLLNPISLTRMGKNAQRYAKKHFLTQTIVQQYEEYYRLILHG